MTFFCFHLLPSTLHDLLLTTNFRPNFVVSLMRTPEMSPYYASFNVPLSFNKLDLSNYLKNVYNVDVLHIRSSVRYQKVQRQKIKRPNSVVQGPLYRPPFLKIMIAELIDPFVYPEPEKDLTAYVTAMLSSLFSVLYPCSYFCSHTHIHLHRHCVTTHITKPQIEMFQPVIDRKY